MDNLESDWGFLPATLALALTPGYFALRICAVDLKNSPETAEALEKIKQCPEAPQISVEVENTRVKPLRAGALPGAEREVDYNEPLVRFVTTTETVNDDSGAISGTTQGTVEGAPTLEVLGLAAGHDGEAPRTMPGPLAMCANHERCGRALRTQEDPACYGAATCALTRMAVDMQSTATPIRLIRMCLAALKWSWCSTTPRRRKCVFDAGQDTLNLVGASEWTLARSGARVGGLSGGGAGVLPATVLHLFKTGISVVEHPPRLGCGDGVGRRGITEGLVRGRRRKGGADQQAVASVQAASAEVCGELRVRKRVWRVLLCGGSLLCGSGDVG